MSRLLRIFRIEILDDLAALLNRFPESGEIGIGVIRDDELGFGTLRFRQSGSSE